jgi:hypothetical protein
MSINSPKLLLLIICIFSIIELILSLYLHIYYHCESRTDVLHFIETSGIIGFLSTLCYFILKELDKNHHEIYLILSNIYFVCMICVSVYWLINLAIESRRFVDNSSIKQCQTIGYYVILISLIGNYLIFLMLIIYVVWTCYSDVNNNQGLYAHATLIH